MAKFFIGDTCVQEKNSDELKSQIDAEIQAHFEATLYRMDNAYLSATEKLEVEFWYQFPGNVSLLIMLGTLTYSAYQPLSWYLILGIPLCVNVVLCVLNWMVYWKTLLRVAHLTLLHNFILWGFTLTAVILLLINGAYWKAAFAFALKLFLSPFLEPHLFLYSIFAHKYHLHPKYLFFRRFYGRQFPFENVIHATNPNALITPPRMQQ